MNRRELISFFGTAGFATLTGFATPGINKQPSSIRKNNNMKTIGILGGLGPQATMDMEMRLHKTAQRLIPPAQNSGYPPIIVHYYRHPPVLLTEQNLPVFPWQPDPRFLEAAKSLGPLVDFIIVPSNGAHVFQKDIEQAAGCKVLSMIDTTLDEVRRRGWKNVGVLGMMNPKVYTSRLPEFNIMSETIDDALQARLNEAIFAVMEGRDGAPERATAIAAIDYLRSKKVDGIVPGCTEIPLILGEGMDAPDLLNPAQLLAEAAIKMSIG